MKKIITVLFSLALTFSIYTSCDTDTVDNLPGSDTNIGDTNDTDGDGTDDADDLCPLDNTVTTGAAFDLDGDLYACSFRNHSVLRYDTTAESFINAFEDIDALWSPAGAVTGPEGDNKFRFPS